MQTQYSVLGYRVDLHFHTHKIAFEVDELRHADRMELKDKKPWKKNLIVCLLGLIRMDKNSTSSKK